MEASYKSWTPNYRRLEEFILEIGEP